VAHKPYGVNMSQHILLPSEFDFVEEEVGSKSYENSWIKSDFDFVTGRLGALQRAGWVLWMLLLSTAFAGIHCAA
jgi:hypothetical protein